MDTPAQIAPRLTEQDLRMAAGAVVFDCRPALLSVSLDVSGIDMRAVRPSIPPAKSVVAPPVHEQEFGGGADLLSYICPEFGVTPLLDSGTDLEDELPSPDASSMVMGHGVALLPAQVEEDVDLAQVLAEFSTLPVIVTPIHDPPEERVVPPAEYRPPEAPMVLLVTPAGPTVVPDDDVQPPTTQTNPAMPTPEMNLLFPGQTWVDPPAGGELLSVTGGSPNVSSGDWVSTHGTNWIHFESAWMSLICLARGRSIFTRTVITPAHCHVCVRIIRVSIPYMIRRKVDQIFRRNMVCSFMTSAC